MSNNRIYAAIGEEAQRGVKEAQTVGFVPLLNPGIPRLEFDDRKRGEFRGEESVKGDSAVARMSQRWGASLDIPFFTEAGSAKGMSGTIFKHFFGKAVSAQNGATGQFCHMFYPVADPFASSNLGTRALTLNLNINEGASQKNWPFVGGRVKGLRFQQEAGSNLKVTAELMGQRRDAVTAEIGSPVFAAENLRCDYTNMRLYTGSVVRTGSAPDFTDLSFPGAVQIKPDKVMVAIENGMDDALRLSGVDYPDKTRMGQFKVTMELTIDWEDPASGFSSADEFNRWVGSSGSTNFVLHWDTGTQAGSGGNHGLYLDLPRMSWSGGEPDYKLEKDPMITLKYEGLYDEAVGYMVGMLLKNTAASV